MPRGRPATPLGSHGEIRFYELPTGKVRARTLLRLHNGKTVNVEATATSKTAAKRSIEQRCSERLGVGESTTISATSKLAQLLDAWHEQHEAKERSKEVYKSAIDKHIKPALGDVRLNELSTQRLQFFLDSLTKGNVRTCNAVLSSAMSLAVRWDVMPSNPMRETKRRKAEKKPVRALTDAQINEYRQSVEAWIKDAPAGYKRGDGLLEIIDVLCGSGMRIGEVLALRWEDINLEKGLVHLCGTVDNKGGRSDTPKTDSSRRTIHVASVAVDALKRQYSKEHTAHLPMAFPSTRGNYRTVVNVERQLRDGRGELKIVPHDFRKTVATRIEDQFGTLAASRHLGHANTTVTESSYLASPEIQPDLTTSFEIKNPRKPPE